MTEPVPAGRWANLRQMLGDGRRYVALTVEAARELLAENAQLVETIRELQRELAEPCDHDESDKLRLARAGMDAWQAEAEQAERQVREIREGIAEVEARCVKAEDELREMQAERERHNCTNDARRLAGKREGVALVRDYLRALSGVSGPTTEAEQ